MEIDIIFKGSLDDLRYPKLYLSNFFIDLKSKVDLYFNQVQNMNKNNQNWNLIIQKIESFEKDCLKINIGDFTKLKLEKNFEDNNIKRYLFLNKTIYFVSYSTYMCQTFLLFISDDYLNETILKFVFDNQQQQTDHLNLLTNDKLKAILLSKLINNHQILNDNLIIETNLNYNKIEQLNLNDHQICSIEENTFKDLLNLKSLNLRWNNLECLNVNMFRDCLNKLEDLYLCQNSVNSIDDFSFKSLQCLQNLYLKFNEITKINELTFNGLENLLILDLSNNSIESIDLNAFSNMLNLTRLSLRYNMIHEINKNEFNLNKLKDLDLANNQISFIEYGSFQMLKNLKELDLSNNKLELKHTINQLDYLDNSIIKLNLDGNITV